MPLYIIATPIGNLKDITLRAIETLRSVDIIACEDTRKAGILLKAHDVTTKTLSYYEHNERKRLPKLLSMLKQGKSIALISNAGTPLISDPGYILVRAAIERNIAVHVIPGPSSILASLVLSCFGVHTFLFQGFLPKKPGRRKSILKGLKNQPHTVVFFESPHRVKKLLCDIIDEIGDRRIAICRELTKRYETVIRGQASTLTKELETLKGECTVVMEGYHGDD